MTLRHLITLAAGMAAGALALACAETNAPAPEPQEVLLAVNSTAATLSVVPVEDLGSAVAVELGGTSPTPVGVAARNEVAIVPLGADNAVAVVDLRSAALAGTIPLPANSGATGVAIVDDSIAYVANPNLNSVSRVNYRTSAVSEVPVGIYPQAVVYARGKLFVLNGNLIPGSADAPTQYLGPSWITVVDPVTNARAGGGDSIPLTGPGNAQFGVEGRDGLLYVISSGNYVNEGRLSVVDPVARAEIASFAGIGAGPGALAAGNDSIYISSFGEGLMTFDPETRTVVRGAGNGLPIPGGNSAVTVDAEGRVYAISAGPCAGGRRGHAHVLRPDLTEIRSIPLGECSIGATVVSVPPG